MFRAQANGKNRLDIVISGKLSTEEMRDALEQLTRESEGIQKGRMLYTIVDFHLPSLGAMAVEFAHLPSLFKLVRKFERAAVLTDKAWIRKVSELEGVLFPGLKIRGFDRYEVDEAEAWLSSREVKLQETR